MSTLAGMEPIERILVVAILTARIKESLPVSIMIVAPSGAGKSKTIERLHHESIHITNDITSVGLIKLLQADRDHKITHIMLKDFNPVLSHKSSVSNFTIANFISLMSEGFIRVDDGREIKLVEHAPVGLLTCVTPEMFQGNLKRWDNLGFRRRFLAICYKYKLTTIDTALNMIDHGKVTGKPLAPIDLNLRSRAEGAPIIPEYLYQFLNSRATTLAQHMGVYAQTTIEPETRRYKKVWRQGTPLYPMSPKATLRYMIQAHALLRNSAEVNKEDADFIDLLLEFTNPGEPKIL